MRPAPGRAAGAARVRRRLALWAAKNSSRVGRPGWSQCWRSSSSCSGCNVAAPSTSWTGPRPPSTHPG
eukprot:1651940-Pyramimonas_sp.AAC.1